MQSRRSSSFQATELGIKKLREAKDSQRLTNEDIAEKTPDVSLSTVKRFFDGKRVRSDNAKAIVENTLGLNLPDIVEANEWESLAESSEIVQKLLTAYRQICQEMLAEKRRLTTNPLTTGDGAIFNYENVYVSLGLMERKRQPIRAGNFLPEQGSQIYEPEYEVTQKFEDNEFFKQILGEGESPKSQGRRIAIVGEPGAGKTTLLQQLDLRTNTRSSVCTQTSVIEIEGVLSS